MVIVHTETRTIQQEIHYGSLVMECLTADAPAMLGAASGRTPMLMGISLIDHGYQHPMRICGGAIMMDMREGRLLLWVLLHVIQVVYIQGKAMCACWSAITVMVHGLYQNQAGMLGISEHRTA